ncbi:hypothetical protein [Parasitella parasitica]|uniref:Uncharacterized protein n=1 Tax=Parasitella parasitica TaxID=35722 RepID=A0A0B7N4Z9_9FUNG|nr:hypothetical protein [Parasitella parasitica]
MAQNIGTLQRKLATLIEEFKRARNTWDEINSHSFPASNTMANLVIQSRYVDEPQYWHPLLTLEFPNIMQKFDAKMQLLIEKQNGLLIDLTDKMAKQYNKMQKLCKELSAVYNHAKESHGLDFVDRQPIYQTCPLNTYVERLAAITDMYRLELNTKKSLVSSTGFAGITTREEGIVLLSIWINQPSIVKSALQEWDDICSTEMMLGAPV